MHVMGSYPAYVAGLLLSFYWVMVFLALKDHPILNFLFQRRSELVQTFDIGPFVFNLLWTEGGLDIVRHHVTWGNFEVDIAFEGVYSTVPCGNLSKVDFVHYIWQNLDMIGMQMHAITILQGHPSQRLPCLHYMASNLGWRTPSRCIGCTDQFRGIFGPLFGCVAPNAPSSCNE